MIKQNIKINGQKATADDLQKLLADAVAGKIPNIRITTGNR